MGDNKRENLRSLSMVSSLGITMVASILIGLAMGYYLDKWFDSSPVCTLLFMALGIISGYRSLHIVTMRELRRIEREDQQKSEDGDGAE